MVVRKTVDMNCVLTTLAMCWRTRSIRMAVSCRTVEAWGELSPRGSEATVTQTCFEEAQPHISGGYSIRDAGMVK